MDEIQILDGFRGEAFATLPCQDGGGSIARYPLFDGVNALLVRLQTHGFEELRDQRDQLEINFCISGRFESVFSLREQAMLTPGGLSVSCFDGLHGAQSTSLFPLGYYEGLCLQIDCAAATRWMQRHMAPLAVDLSALRANLLGSRWFMLGEAGPRCEHVLRELYENLPYFDREYLQLKVLELLMLLRSMPRAERETEYCSAEQVRLVSHLRDHLLTERDSYVSLSRLAEEHHLSVSHLQKLFRQVYGAPICRYLKEYRLEKAAVELSGSERRIVEIALTGLAETAEADYLGQIPGTYVELFPELSKEEYHGDWLAAVTPLVGEENAEATVEYLLYVCTGDVYGEEAIAKYSADPEIMRFDCCYIGGVAKMTIEGNVISGVDAEGNEIFRHTYAPVEVENNENGFIFYKTEDENADQFTYFAFGSDTMAETFHLEFRYAEDLADLMSWFEGNYAYWNVGAIAENYTEEKILGAINLFATENLSEEE